MAGEAQGLIPAGAGNMTLPQHSMSGIWAHPRGCGEHRVRYIPLLPLQGSSPRVRGTSTAYRSR